MIPRLGFVSPGRPPRLTADTIVTAVINDVNKSDIVNSQADFNLGLPRPPPIINQNNIGNNQIYLREQQRPMEEVIESAQHSPSRSLAPALYSPTNDIVTPLDVTVIEGDDKHAPIDINKIKSGGKGAYGQKSRMFYSLKDIKMFLTRMGRKAPVDRSTAENTLYSIVSQYEQNKASRGTLSNLDI